MKSTNSSPASLVQLPRGRQGVIVGLELPEDVARRLMELGFVPGNTVVAARSAPGGDPRVYRIDGAEVALRHETAAHILVRETNGAPSDE